MPKSSQRIKEFAGDLWYNIGMGFCNFLWDAADKLEDFTATIKINEAVLETVPRQFAEKKRKKIPSGGVFDFPPLRNIEVTESRIKVHHVLDGFDEESLLSAKKRIGEAAAFILNNAESTVEKHIAGQLVKMFMQGAVLITDADLVLDKPIAGCFYTKDGNPYIGLDIAELQKMDDPYLIQTLAHEAYHAWRYFTSRTEYSIIDEKRAWNMGLRFSNKYRNLYGIPIQREKEYTESELLEYDDYCENANVNVRFGPGETLIEKIGYGIANVIEDAADVVDGWTDKIMDKTFQEYDTED
jgi:hypothetical protein